MREDGSIGQALAVNRVLTNLDFSDNIIGAKGSRKIGQSLQVKPSRRLILMVVPMHLLRRLKGLSL